MITQLDNDDDDERLIDRLLVFGLFFITRCSFVFMEFLRFPAIFFLSNLHKNTTSDYTNFFMDFEFLSHLLLHTSHAAISAGW